MNKIFLMILLVFVTEACTTMEYKKTVTKLDINKYMGKWYVVAGRFTFLESEVHNALEEYTWNDKEKRIDIAFHYNKGSLTGPIRSIPQKGWIEDVTTNAHWKVSPIWPIKVDYLVIDIDEEYSWVVVGVPNQKYIWIMSREPHIEKNRILDIIKRIEVLGYNTKDIIFVPHNI